LNCYKYNKQWRMLDVTWHWLFNFNFNRGVIVYGALLYVWLISIVLTVRDPTVLILTVEDMLSSIVIGTELTSTSNWRQKLDPGPWIPDFRKYVVTIHNALTLYLLTHVSCTYFNTFIIEFVTLSQNASDGFELPMVAWGIVIAYYLTS
jgi:hypothetical protein